MNIKLKILLSWIKFFLFLFKEQIKYYYFYIHVCIKIGTHEMPFFWNLNLMGRYYSNIIVVVKFHNPANQIYLRLTWFDWNNPILPYLVLRSGKRIPSWLRRLLMSFDRANISMNQSRPDVTRYSYLSIIAHAEEITFRRSRLEIIGIDLCSRDVTKCQPKCSARTRVGASVWKFREAFKLAWRSYYCYRDPKRCATFIFLSVVKSLDLLRRLETIVWLFLRFFFLNFTLSWCWVRQIFFSRVAKITPVRCTWRWN